MVIDTKSSTDGIGIANDVGSDVSSHNPIGGGAASFANVLQPERVPRKVNFRPLVNANHIDNHDTLLPKAAMEGVLSRYDNTLVGYFIGKNIAFPLVQNYVTNTWGKFGLKKLMKNDAGVFLFKFESKEGVDSVLQRGPWIIRGSPLLISRWTPDSSLTKNEVTSLPVWVKLHNVPLLAYSEDGLSLIATQVGKPIMLDVFTSSMCFDSWGRISYARALVELSSDSVLKQEVTMAIPNKDDNGITTARIKVEYEWKPPHCQTCQVFGHDGSCCPKVVKPQHEAGAPSTGAPDDGFKQVYSRRAKAKGKKTASGFHVGKGANLAPKKQTYVAKKKNSDASTSGAAVPTSNTYEALGGDNDDNGSPCPMEDGTEVGSSSKGGNDGTTPMVEKINMIEDLIMDGKATLLGDDGKPLKQVGSSGNPFSKVGNVVVSDSEDEVDEMDAYGGGHDFEEDLDGYDDYAYASQIYDLPGSLKSFKDTDFKLQGRRK